MLSKRPIVSDNILQTGPNNYFHHTIETSEYCATPSCTFSWLAEQSRENMSRIASNKRAIDFMAAKHSACGQVDVAALNGVGV